VSLSPMSNVTTTKSIDFTDELVKLAFLEDQPNGDLTTDVIHGSNGPKVGRVKVMAKEDLVLSGQIPFTKAMHFKDPSIKLDWSFKDGQVVLAQQIAVVIQGNQIPILAAERVALNFLGRLSGIATMTRTYVKQLEGSSVQLLDTRKTTPGYRHLEKRAVLHGGGVNHRMNLSDAVLIKDNHIALAGGVQNALKNAVNHYDGPIEIEVDNLDQLKQCLPFRVSRVLLDNMDNNTIKQAIDIIPKDWEVEVSGGITLERLALLKELKINFISVGAITHSAPTVDFSMEFDL